MNRRIVSTMFVLSFCSGLLGCGGKGGGAGGGGGTGGGGGGGVSYSGSGYVLCDPDVDLFDDVVYIFTFVDPTPEGVTAFWNGGSPAMELEYDASDDSWSTWEYADFLDTDCDKVGRHSVDFEGYKDGEVVYSETVVMEMAR